MSLDVMKQALELLESAHVATDLVWRRYDCITALRAAIEQAQEPVDWRWKERINDELDNWVVTSCEPPPYAVEKQPLYTAPRQWQGLTQREIDELWDLHHDDYGNALSASGYERAIEAKLREKNT